MARNTVGTGTSVVLNQNRAPDPANPHTHLVLVGDAGGASDTRVMFGCLRPAFRGHVNSAAAFALAKVTVAAPPDTPPWTPTAARVEVLLPAGACDRFSTPQMLMETVDAERPAKINALLAYVTFTFPVDRLHEQWELVRAFVRASIVDPGEVGVLLVQHAPNRAGSANPPHVHAMIAGPRRMTPLGLAEAIPAFVNDNAHPLIRNAFREFQAKWPRCRSSGLQSSKV